MAIHPIVRTERIAASNLTQQDITAWTEQAASSLQILDISDSVAEVDIPIASAPTFTTTGIRGTSSTLSIPLDGPIPTRAKASSPRVKIVQNQGEDGVSTVPSNTYRRREPMRRDSLKRREALLKGKEGSRRRQRWENGMLFLGPTRFTIFFLLDWH